jgi:hypothetical protein
LALAALAAGALALASTGQAFAVWAPRVGDVVGVGADTGQYADDFLFNGDPAGDVGFNLAKVDQVDTFSATGDGNDRLAYDGFCGGTNIGTSSASGEAPCSATNLKPDLMNESAVLRGSSLPVPLPIGTTAGIAALLADSASPGYQGLDLNTIQFVSAARPPTAAEQSSCAAISDCGGLHVYEYADDNLEIVTAPTTNAPPLSAVELAAIYFGVGPDAHSGCVTNFDQLPGESADNHLIHPVLPLNYDPTLVDFETDLATAASYTGTLGACPDVTTAFGNDPTGITLAGASAEPNAIEPFSAAKALLLETNPETWAPSTTGGYFANSGEPGAYLDVSLIRGCSVQPTGIDPSVGACPVADEIKAADGNPVFDVNQGLYFLVRQSALASTSPMEPGGTENFVQTLFEGSSSWIASANQAGNIEESGLDPHYADLGLDSAPLG